MQYEKIARSYKAQSIQTASPGKLVLMLFDGALRFMSAAKRAFEEEEFTKKNEDINNNLIRAQNCSRGSKNGRVRRGSRGKS